MKNKNKTINESSTTTSNPTMVDDGPYGLSIYKDFDSYANESPKIYKKLGMEIEKWLVDKNFKTYFPDVKIGNEGGKPLQVDKIKMIADKLGYKILDKYIRKNTKVKVVEYLKMNKI